METEIYKSELNEKEIIVIKFVIPNLSYEFSVHFTENTSFDCFAEENLKENEFTMFVLDEGDVDDCIGEMKEFIYNYNQENISDECPSEFGDLCKEYDKDFITEKDKCNDEILYKYNGIIPYSIIEKEWKEQIKDCEFYWKSEKEDIERGL